MLWLSAQVLHSKFWMQIELGKPGGEHMKYQNQKKVHWLDIQAMILWALSIDVIET